MSNTQQLKKCGRCKESKPLAEFRNAKRSKDGKQGYCKVCQSEYRKEHGGIRISITIDDSSLEGLLSKLDEINERRKTQQRKSTND